MTQDFEASILDNAYNMRVQQQIDQFVDQPIHGLPEIFHVWSHNFLLPALEDVFSVGSVNDFYKKAVYESSDGYKGYCRILSIGCGDGDIEINIAKSLLEDGFVNFRIEAIDLSPVLIERFESAVDKEALEKYVFPIVQDLNSVSWQDKYDVVIANHCLHHIVELESVFDTIFNALDDEGIFATCDMIGRNGHMRWPETEKFLQIFWPLLSEKQRFQHQLKRFDEEKFVDHDCSSEGFEGIRAQDILYLLLNKFFPHKFLGYGGFIDTLVDRGYGPGFSQQSAWDREFITAVAKINDLALDSGLIKPTSMMAYFTKSDRGSTHYRNRSAHASLRLPFQTPLWSRS